MPLIIAIIFTFIIIKLSIIYRDKRNNTKKSFTTIYEQKTFNKTYLIDSQKDVKINSSKPSFSNRIWGFIYGLLAIGGFCLYAIKALPYLIGIGIILFFVAGVNKKK